MSSESSPAIGVALCLGVASSLSEGVLDAVLPARSVPVWAEPGLCRRRGALRDFVREHRLEKLVMGACGRPGEEESIERELRAAGLAPWDIATVRLDWWAAGAEARAALLVVAALARLSASVPVHPDNYSLRFAAPSGPVSRRGLLGLSPLRPRVVPSIDPLMCAAWNGCRLCLGACPRGALSAEGGEIRLNRVHCDGCGLCTAACPAGAICFPGWMAQELDAALQALLLTPVDSLPSRTIAIACQEAFGRLGAALGRSQERLPGLLPMAVPNLGMATAFLVLRSLSLGAAGVMLFACSEGCRSHGGQGRLPEQMPALRDLLAGLGLDGSLCGPFEFPADGQRVPEEVSEFAGRAAEPRAGAAAEAAKAPLRTYHVAPALVGAAQRFGVSPETRVSGADLGFASLQLDGERCSLCGLCAAACPSRALHLSESGKKVTLWFVALQCAGCGLCVAACPESALAVKDHLSLGELSATARRLRTSAKAVCRRCGTAIAPSAMAAAVRRRLGGSERLASLLEYCPDCRLMAALREPQVLSR